MLMVRRPWFRRKWIVQEVALAKETTMYAGGIEVLWSELSALCYKLESLGLVDYVTNSHTCGIWQSSLTTTRTRRILGSSRSHSEYTAPPLSN